MRAEWLDSWPGVVRDRTLARHSQYGIGGPADWYLQLDNPAALGELLPRCAAAGIPVTVLGAGSNTLILDGGVRGLVLRLTDRRLERLDATTVQLSGGQMMPRAALDCAKQGLAGLEFGIGIPGTCGASVWGNAGAFGREVKDALLSCDAVGPDGLLTTYALDDCGFGYRTSRFKRDLRSTIVVAARFAVHDDEPSSVRARTDAIQADRKASQPYGIRSLGSVFQNPPGDRAGRLIEAAGLKGTTHGGAEISTKHANFIVNRDHATAADVAALVERAHAVVRERFGVDLQREIVYLGEPAPASTPGR
ncbi:MAG: UDP-N-acetylmuramate dehydrogenase [Candidatus Dormibacteria bacterium]